jgi:hypothetical protein
LGIEGENYAPVWCLKKEVRLIASRSEDVEGEVAPMKREIGKPESIGSFQR